MSDDRPIRRDQDGRLLPGSSGNLGGRPKGWAGLAAEIKERFGLHLEKLVDVAQAMLADRRTPAAVRLGLLAWLADRAVGRPVQAIELAAASPAAEPGIPVEQFTADEKRILFEVFKAARARANSAELHDNAGNGADEKGGQPFALPEPPTDE